MKRIFTKQDLKTGDIVVLRNGESGFVYTEKRTILYPNADPDRFNAFTESLLSNEKDNDKDIMAIYRSYKPLGFRNYSCGDLVFDRVSGKIYLDYAAPAQAPGLRQSKRKKGQPEEKLIHGIMVRNQWSEIDLCEEHLWGHLLEMPSMDIDRTDIQNPSVLEIPGSDGLVIIYHQFQENRRIERKSKPDGYQAQRTSHPRVAIPESNIRLFSHCFICRRDAGGHLDNLHDEDFAVIMDYLSL